MKVRIVFLLLVFVSLSSFSQLFKVGNSNKQNPANFKAIVKDDVVKGYYAFYFVDKLSYKESLYKLEILDENMNLSYSVDMKRPAESIPLESSYNGSGFCFSFLNNGNVIDYVFLDKTGKETGIYKTRYLTVSEVKTTLEMTGTDDNIYSGGLAAVESKGFVRYGYEQKKGMRIAIEMFDTQGKKLWSANSDVRTKRSYESILPYFSNDRFVVSMLHQREKMLSKKVIASLIFHDVDSGKELFRLPTVTPENSTWPLGLTYDDKRNEFLLFGEYFQKDENPMKSKSQGFYFQTIDMNGKVVSENEISWTSDVSKFIALDSKNRMENKLDVAILKMIRTADGKFFAIGEQFKKAVSGSSIARAAMTNNAISSMNVELYDMMVFEFNPDKKLAEVHTIQKDKTKIEIPKKYERFKNAQLIYLLRSNGWFNYSFCSASPDRKTFNVGYINYDRDKENGSKYVIGNVSYTNEHKIVGDKIELKSRPDWFFAVPAKPGYVGVFEFFQRDQEVKLRLEKLNL